MPKRCILTDSTCLLAPQSNSASIPVFNIELKVENSALTVRNPSSVEGKYDQRSIPVKKLILPEMDHLHQLFSKLTSEYDEILCITISSCIHPLYECVLKAANSCRGNHKIRVIDSLTTAAGLGLLVKSAQKEFNRQRNSEQTEAVIRSEIPNIFSAYCTSDITTLHANQLADLPQAVISRMLGTSVIFSIEDGVLTPVSKAKNPQSAIEFFVEFVSEFELLETITFIHSANPMPYDLSFLKDQISTLFPSIPLSQVSTNPGLSALLGDNAFGLVVQQRG